MRIIIKKDFEVPVQGSYSHTVHKNTMREEWVYNTEYVFFYQGQEVNLDQLDKKVRENIIGRNKDENLYFETVEEYNEYVRWYNSVHFHKLEYK